MINTPTATSMKMRFKQFVSFDDSEIEFALEEARIACGAGDEENHGWIDDQNLILGIQYYAAHFLQLTLNRSDTLDEEALKASESTPELSISWATPPLPPWPSAEQIADYNQTMYGMRYKALMRKNFPAVLVANCGVRF